jgi:hypothetical protein
VVLATEAFEKLLRVVLRARQAPDPLALVLKGNPEYLEGSDLVALADKVLDEVVRRLTSGTSSCDGLIA